MQHLSVKYLNIRMLTVRLDLFGYSTNGLHPLRCIAKVFGLIFFNRMS